jgi:hypothetical protein
MHKEVGFGVVNKLIQEAAAYGRPDTMPKMAGDRDLNVILSPLPRDKRAKNPRAGQTPPSAPPAGIATPNPSDTP